MYNFNSCRYSFSVLGSSYNCWLTKGETSSVWMEIDSVSRLVYLLWWKVDWNAEWTGGGLILYFCYRFFIVASNGPYGLKPIVDLRLDLNEESAYSRAESRLDISFFSACGETRLERYMLLFYISKSDSRRVSEFCLVLNYLESKSIIKIL